MVPKQEKRGRGRPATGQMPKRYFRMDDDSWAIIEKAAGDAGKSVSEFIRDTMLRAAKRRTEG
jgi:uncharacterized protein (DUF1778 family)